MKKILFILLSLGICFRLNAQTKPTTQSGIPVFSSEKEKLKWISEHKEEYKKAGGVCTPDVDKEKPKLVKSSSKGESTSDFPVYIDTGDPLHDRLQYEKKLEDWYAKKMAINEKRGVYNQSGEDKIKWIEQNKDQYKRK